MRSRMMITLLLGTVVSSSAQVADSTGHESLKKNTRSVKPLAYIIPAAMVTYGLVALKSKPLIQLDQNIKQAIWDNNPHNKTNIDDYTGFVPIVAVYALNMAGIKGKHNLVDRSIMLVLSYGVAGAVVTSAKHLTNKLRPNGSNRLSFPSGHTSQAFVSAEFLRMEYKHISPWYGIGGYTVAALTGYLRMYNNKHWLSDIVAGAGVGILSVQATYWVYPKLKKLLVKKNETAFIILPYYQQQTGGLLFVYQFK